MLSSRHPVSLPSLVRGRAGLGVDWRRLAEQERGWVWDFWARAAVAASGVVLFQPVLFVAGALLLIVPLRRYLGVVSLMREGEPLPAKLVSVEPPMVAAYGDLSRGLGPSHPVLVVFEVPAAAFSEPIQRGDRVAVVGQGMGGDAEHWEGLRLRLASTVTTDSAALQRTMDAVQEWDWESLDEALFEVAARPEAGVYAVH